MASQRFDLTVEPRKTGKHSSRSLRSNRKVPAVVYGALKQQYNVTLEEGAVLKFNTRAHENALFNLKSSDSALNNIVVLMKDVQVHPLSRRPEHVDLFALDLKKPVRVSIEIKIEGKPIGIADGGLLNVVNRQIEVECLPTEIPEGVTADVSNLGVGDALHLSDLSLPQGIKLISSPDMTIAVVNIVEEEATTPTPTPAADAAAAPAAGAAAPAAGAAAPKADAKAAPAKEEKKK
jgi:large subunit ribosomal protein L25